MEVDERTEIQVGQDVAIAYQHAFVDAIGGETDAAGGTEWLVFDDEAQLHVTETLVGKVVGERIRQVAK